MTLLIGGRRQGCRVEGGGLLICHTRNRSILLTSKLEQWLGQILLSSTTHCLLPPRIQHQLSSTTCSTIKTAPALIFPVHDNRRIKRGEQNEGVGEYDVLSPLLICAKNLAETLTGAWRRDEPATLGSRSSPPCVYTWMEDTRVVRLWATVTCHLIFTCPSSYSLSVYVKSLQLS
jgi:hypothetical protein